MILLVSVAAGLFLAYANGANDNFKGVATLLGTGTTSYRRALYWATLTTGLGSAAALLLARGLLSAFSGKGLVPPDVVANPAFPLSVGFAAGTTVLLATRLGFPISTTHSLIGGLVGAGLVASPAGIDGSQLARTFLAPLLVSPFLAASLAFGTYPLLRFLRLRLGVEQETCVCVGHRVVGVVPGAPGREPALRMIRLPSLELGETATCRVRYRGDLLGVSARAFLDASHYLSAGIVSFARGLNDTPKMAALLLVGQAVAPAGATAAIGAAIAVGGLLGARPVARKMAYQLTAMNPGQGFTANIVTGLLVVGASRLGVPVSTTHVSCGSLFGIGAATRQGRWETIGRILLAWVITLPLGGILGAVAFQAFRLAGLG